MAHQRIIPSDSLASRGITISNDQRKRLEDAGQFPRRVPVTARTHGYIEDEINRYLDSRIELRDQSAAA
jgi:predicted DNA-binding transcriptional regulator AlpA